VIRGALATSTSSAAAGAAQAALDAGGTAVDAVLAGYFAVAGEHAGGLFAPAVLLVAGPGAGARAFDGRAAQPGREGRRPRGFVHDEDVPAAARAAAPRAVHMALLAHAQRGKLPLRDLVRAGVTEAEGAGAPARAALLLKIAQGGATALASDRVLGALVEAAGPAVGGSLTGSDVADAAPGEEAAVERMFTAAQPDPGDDGGFAGQPGSRPQTPGAPTGEGSRAVLLPTSFEVPRERGSAVSVVAVDRRGLAAALSLDVRPFGVVVADLEVELPARAEPVRRGVTRLPPGTPLAADAPLAIAFGPRGLTIALALPGAGSLAAVDLGALFSGQALEAAAAEVAAQAGAARALGVVRDAHGARSLT
jgi:gamma-glutamyltranspeptidase/glutathione hydrolase